MEVAGLKEEAWKEAVVEDMLKSKFSGLLVGKSQLLSLVKGRAFTEEAECNSLI